jgi:hypothetical protein
MRDHRAEHLAAQLDEFVDTRFEHVRDAFAPADHSGDLLSWLRIVSVGLRAQ